MMRILHTADLHLGRSFNGLPMEDDHRAALDRIAETVTERRADVLVIAGDVFDRTAPSVAAVAQFNAFLARIVGETEAAVVMIAGNHDSGDRIEMMSTLGDPRRGIVRGVPRVEERPFVLEDDHGPVAFSALPFCYEYAAQACFGDPAIRTPQAVMAAQVAAARGYVPAGARWVVVAHAFVAGADPTEGEQSLVRSVGGIETVSPGTFDGAHYVALGHLHRPQGIGTAHVRYSGSPLAFGFDEAGARKSMSLVEMDAAGGVSIEEIPFVPARGVRVLHGRHAELLAAPPSDDFIRAVLTDGTPVIDAMSRLRAVFPNACELIYERDARAPETKSFAGPAPRAASPHDMMRDFLGQVRGDGMTADEGEVLAGALGAMKRAEDAA